MSTGLTSVYIIEKDKNKDLFSWAFTHDPVLDTILQDRSGLKSVTIPYGFFCSRYESDWQYFLNTSVDNGDSLCQITDLCFVVTSKQYNIGKYSAQLQIFSEHYLASYDSGSHRFSTTGVMTAFLSASVAGKTSTPASSSTPLKWDDNAYDARLSLVTPIHKFLETFGMESILVWVAVLTKKRILVLAETQEQASITVRALLTFGAWHRRNEGMLRPYITFSDAELKDLSMLSTYIAGTTDEKAKEKASLYDLLIDMPNGSIITNPAVKTSFQLGKYHKTVIDTILQATKQVATVENQVVAAQAVIKVIAGKTKELLDQLQACIEEHGSITNNTLTSMGVPQNLQQFMIEVAEAEHLNKQ